DGGVGAARGQEPAVGRKGEGSDGTTVAGEGGQRGAGERVPQPYLLIVPGAQIASGVLVGCGDEQATVGREAQHCGPVAVVKGQPQPSGGDFPDADLVVVGARGQGSTVGGEGQRQCPLLPRELVLQPPRLHVPDQQVGKVAWRKVPAARGEESAVGGEGQRVDLPLRRRQPPQLLARGVPQ